MITVYIDYEWRIEGLQVMTPRAGKPEDSERFEAAAPELQQQGWDVRVWPGLAPEAPEYLNLSYAVMAAAAAFCQNHPEATEITIVQQDPGSLIGAGDAPQYGEPGTIDEANRAIMDLIRIPD